MVLASQMMVLRKRSSFNNQCDVPTFRLMATSSLQSRESKFLNLKSATESGRILLSDRKGWWEHMTTTSLVKSTIRVAAVQGSNMVANYLQDQLQADFAREELVKDNLLSDKQADEQQQEWEEREWNLRLKALPNKILTGILKFHAITLLMRFYESIADKMVDEFTLDRLTRDPYDAAIISTKLNDTNSAIRQEMYSTCLWANIIAFMADYSVHQIILTYTYYQYYQQKKTRRKSSDQETEEDAGGELVLSYLTKSSSLVISRSIGLFAAAFGGAWGSVIYPGWGTLVGSQFCDGVVASVFDELQPAVMKVQL